LFPDVKVNFFCVVFAGAKVTLSLKVLPAVNVIFELLSFIPVIFIVEIADT
jgi:hypothetical protein